MCIKTFFCSSLIKVSSNLHYSICTITFVFKIFSSSSFYFIHNFLLELKILFKMFVKNMLTNYEAPMFFEMNRRVSAFSGNNLFLFGSIIIDSSLNNRSESAEDGLMIKTAHATLASIGNLSSLDCQNCKVAAFCWWEHVSQLSLFSSVGIKRFNVGSAKYLANSL